MIKSLLFTSLIRFTGVSLLAVNIMLLAACSGGGSGSNGATGNGSDTTPVNISGGDSISNPATLALETLYNDSISAGGTIYYRFTTGTRSLKYLVDLQNVSEPLGWTLYSDAAYSVYKDSCSQTTDVGDCNTFSKLSPETTYFLKLQNYSAVNTSFTIRLDRILEPEGTLDIPVVLTVGSEYIGMLGPKKYSSDVSSYYQFTTGIADSTYTISLTGATTDVRWKLFSGGWNAGVRDCDDSWGVGDESCATPTLSANTTYYLQIVTQGPQGSFVNILINQGGSHVNSLVSEGSVGSPIVLTPGTTSALTVAPLETSYYQFTTGDVPASYSFELGRVSTVFDFFVHDDAAFTNSIGGAYNGMSSSYRDVKETTVALDPNTTYYVSLKNFRDVEDKIELNLYEDTPQDPDSEGTSLTPVVLSVNVLHNGTIGSQAASYYKFTLPESKPYMIQFRGAAVELSSSVTQEFFTLSSSWANCTMLTGFDMDCRMGTANAGSELVMHLYNYATTPTTFDVLITPIEGEGEGSSTTPVAIDVGTTFNSSAGVINNYSFYEFTTGPDPVKHSISVSGASTAIEWTIDDPDVAFTTKECLNPGLLVANWICDTEILKPNTRFIMTVRNLEATSTAYSIDVTAVPTQSIALDSTLIAETVNLNNGHYNYYQFTTDAVNTDYTFSITNNIVFMNLDLFTDNAFTSHIIGYDSFSGPDNIISRTYKGLAPSTTYYLRTNPGNYSSVGTYDLTVHNDGFTDTDAALTLGVDYSAKIASGGISTYHFTTNGGSPAIHGITLTGDVRIQANIYSDAAMTNFKQGCNLNYGTSTCLGTGTLSGSTVYYVKVQDTGIRSGTFTLNITPQ